MGAAAGAVTGAVTNESQINLGQPAWKQGAAGKPPVTSSTVAEIQSGLVRLGYNPGPVDGVLGSRTREAIRAYQRDRGLLVDGQATPELAAHIQAGKS
ncbi:MAG: peptidoglycan-binding protein [Gammaproteobacteria bacterium]|nr:peptidoglycan-binding protein [Gammaproteobacteria bacterium]